MRYPVEAPRVGRATCEPLPVYPGSQQMVLASWCQDGLVFVLIIVGYL